MLHKAAVAGIAMALTLVLLFAFQQPGRHTRRVVLALLRNVPTLFLATTRSEQLCVTHLENGSWLWGARKGLGSIEVRTHLGVDLHKLKPGDIRVNGADVAVRLPEPEVLDVVPDLSTWRYVSKASGLQHLRDAVRGRNVRDELMAAVQDSLPRYRNATLYTDRAAIADRLNREATNLFGPTGLSVKFE